MSRRLGGVQKGLAGSPRLTMPSRGACYSRKDLDFLAEKDLNGRQVSVWMDRS